jgi:uncharacterized membrane protein YfcA
MLLQDTATGLDAKTVLLAALGLVTLGYVVVLARGVREVVKETGESARPTLGGLITGFITDFFDTLGIGSFAPTTAIFRNRKMVRDEKIPGTLNIGHTLPTILQAFIFTKIVPVDSTTLILLIIAAVLGAWLGAGIVARWPRRKVQVGMGGALVAAAALMAASALSIVPAGGDALALRGTLLVVGIIANFGLGALMTIGIGLYGPCLILVSLLGMNPTAAFPIMMGSCAFLMPAASTRFIRERGFDARATLGLLAGGIPAVLVAAFIVKSLPLTVVRWLVVVVVLYTAVTLLMAAMKKQSDAVSASGQPDTVTL